MGMLGRIASAVRSALDRVVPEASAAQEIDTLLADLAAHQKNAVSELVAYKAFEKQSAERLTMLGARATELSSNAEKAVRAGNDALAKEALVEAQRVRAELAELNGERAAATAEAAQLLAARRELATRIKLLESKKGTLAGELARGRNQGPSMGADGPAWDALARAEERIALADAEAELEASVSGQDSAAALDAGLKRANAERELADLKAKLALPPKPAGQLNPKK